MPAKWRRGTSAPPCRSAAPVEAVITVVVAFEAPQLLPALQGLGAVGEAAASAAIGDTAAQGFGLATGIQSQFGW